MWTIFYIVEQHWRQEKFENTQDIYCDQQQKKMLK